MSVILKERPYQEEDFLSEVSDPLLQRIYAARGVRTYQSLDRQLESLLSPESLEGAKEAAIRLYEALKVQACIVIVGDFDADGATSTTLAVSQLRLMGFEHVHYLVPNRFEYGYGLTPEIVALAQTRFAPQLIVTVDNGITSIAGVQAANDLNIDVIVTDHHLPGETLPDAVAIVNPNLKTSQFQSKSLAGVGVMFYVLLALRKHLREVGWFSETRKAPNLANALDLVALGTVADLVPLDQNNRILVEHGMRRIRNQQCVPGILALLQLAKRSVTHLKESDLGFALGPRLNAAGRLEDMSLGIECLLAKEFEKAFGLATQLDVLNHQRRDIESEMKEEAYALLEALPEAQLNQSLSICLYESHWHQGVIGILASRLKERFHCPVIVFAKAGDGLLKGSGRSISGLDLRSVLASVDVKHPGLIEKFGGHVMAAGLTLKATAFDVFKKSFQCEVKSALKGVKPEAVCWTDGRLEEADLTLECLERLDAAGPWGQGFEPPVFQGVFEVLSHQILNGVHLKLRLRLKEGGQVFEGIQFFAALERWEESPPTRVEIAYQLDAHRYFGEPQLQLMVRALNLECAAV